MPSVPQNTGDFLVGFALLVCFDPQQQLLTKRRVVLVVVSGRAPRSEATSMRHHLAKLGRLELLPICSLGVEYCRQAGIRH
jgi:hypothetical protein